METQQSEAFDDGPSIDVVNHHLRTVLDSESSTDKVCDMYFC